MAISYRPYEPQQEMLQGAAHGNQPFHPAMMVKVLVYGYAAGVFSSRKIERRVDVQRNERVCTD